MFLETLLGCCGLFQQQVCLTLTAIHPDGKHPTPSRHISLADRETLGEALNQLCEVNQAGWGAYFAVGLRKPGLTRFRRGGLSDVMALPALFADVDCPTAETLLRLRATHPTPSILVSSGGGYHAYWLLHEPLTDMEAARRVLQALAKEVNGDSVSLAQSMRLPGTVNTKPNRGALCQVVEMSDKRYALSDFNHLVSRLHIQQPAQTHIAKPHVTQSDAKSRTLNPDLIHAVTEILCRDYAAQESRSNPWMAALCPCGHRVDKPGKHFFWNPEIGCGHCHGRHGRLRLTDLCSVLSINAASYGGIYAMSV